MFYSFHTLNTFCYFHTFHIHTFQTLHSFTFTFSSRFNYLFSFVFVTFTLIHSHSFIFFTYILFLDFSHFNLLTFALSDFTFTLFTLFTSTLQAFYSHFNHVHFTHVLLCSHFSFALFTFTPFQTLTVSHILQSFQS